MMRSALLLGVLVAGCTGSPTARHPLVFAEIADRTTNLGPMPEVSVAATLNGEPAGFAMQLDAVAASARLVTYPEIAAVPAHSRRADLTPQSATEPQFRYVLSPDAPLSARWYAIELPAGTDTIDVEATAGIAGASGHRYVRFRGDSYPVAREVQLPPGRDMQRVYVHISEAVDLVDGAISLSTSGGDVACSLVAGAGPVSGSPFSAALDCQAFEFSRPLTVRFAMPISSSSGVPLQNVGADGHPSEFAFTPSELPMRGNVPTFVLPD